MNVYRIQDPSYEDMIVLANTFAEALNIWFRVAKADPEIEPFSIEVIQYDVATSDHTPHDWR